MSWLSEIDIFTFGLTLLQLVGEYIEYTPRKIMVFRVVNCAICIMVKIFIVSNLGDPKSEGFVANLENLAVAFHTIFKYLMFMYNKNDLREMLNAKMKHFWTIPRENKHVAGKIRSIYEGINLLQITMLADVILIFEFYVLSPCFHTSNPFIFASNVFVNSIAMEVVVLFCQYYVVALMTSIILGYDFLYLCLCIELKVQVKLLKYKLKEVFTKTSGDALFNIWMCIKQHNFLLLMHKKLQNMYSKVLLFHYFFSLLSVCVDMYQSFVGQSRSLSSEALKFMSIAAVIGEFAFYCVPAELLSSEFTDIARALYMSKWYKHRPGVQKLMIPIMTRSQRPHYFSAAGLLDINIDAFGSVIRKAFSLYAVLRNILDK